MRPPAPEPSAAPAASARLAPRLVFVVAAAVGTLGTLGSCRSAASLDFNLKELRNEDGTAKMSGRAMGALEYSFTTLLGGTGLTDGPDSRDAREYGNPDKMALKNLMRLAEEDESDPYIAAIQIENYAWLGASDRYVLARERCVIELGKAALRMGIVGPSGLPIGEVAATDAELVAALEAVVGAVTRLYEEDVDGESWNAMIAAADGLRALPMDHAGARKSLHYLNRLVRTWGSDPETIGPLFELIEHVATICVRRTLAIALVDDNEWVRAAAHEACAPLGSDTRFQLFLMGAQDPSEEVQVRWLEWVKRFGLPTAPAGVGPDQLGLPLPPDTPPAALHHQVRAFLLRAIMERTRPANPGRVSAAACRALAVVSGAEITALRYEDWAAWWRDWVEDFEERTAAIAPAPSAGATP